MDPRVEKMLLREVRALSDRVTALEAAARTTEPDRARPPARVDAPADAPASPPEKDDSAVSPARGRRKSEAASDKSSAG